MTDTSPVSLPVPPPGTFVLRRDPPRGRSAGPGDVRGVFRIAKARRVARGLAGLELWIAPEGVTYACAAGIFPAPWTAVRGIFFNDVLGRARPAPELIVEVAGWGGPLAEYEKADRPCQLRIPLEGLGVDRPTIARAVHEISSGQASVPLG